MVKPSFGRNGSWSDEDDAKTLAPASKHVPRNSVATSKKTGIRRCGKSCRLRWADNCASTSLKHESFTPEEEDLIIRMHAAIGSRWPLIAQQLQGKTENDVKMFWKSKLKKKLTEMGIDPVTHRPFSHILADYGNINGETLTPNPSARSGSLSRNLRHPLSFSRSEKDSDPNQVGEPGDLLSHLEAIKFMTVAASAQVKPETFLPDFYNGPQVLLSSSALSDSFSSSSSTASTSSATPQENTDLNFSWSDFLLDQEIFPENHQKPEELDNSFAYFSEAVTVTTSTASESNETKQKKDENPSNGFVESIIAKEKEMYLGFPSYYEQPLYD
ncbi:PREDICTED: transcription factor MYB35 [Tarenaya hassleriana]|uniref:transcription factor MYB35 n=1 Tax=Tarenaya hassleriana TaxID=28532 RepID=UPI00053C6C2C|nr:PREDICTED: transcription factor MYB35 [Tarenaya hassleriana]